MSALPAEILDHKGIGNNLRFLILEVDAQVRRLADFIREQNDDIAKKIRERDDYIDQLKARIERKTFELAAESSTDEDFRLDILKAIEVTAVNLERISDFCCDALGHLRMVDDSQTLEANLLASADLVSAGISDIQEAMEDGDVELALGICEREVELDHLYAEALREAKQSLTQGDQVDEDVAAIFVAHYFERMGDSLLNIGESIVSAFLGERVKIPQIGALDSIFGKASLDELSLEEMGETKSGCQIARVTQDNDRRMIIFKAGKKNKLAAEKESIDKWQEIFPGLVPQIYAFHDRGLTGAILYEYLPGSTIEEVLLQHDLPELARALARVTQTFRRIWTETRTEEPSQPRFISQLKSRLDGVYTIHPEFRERHFRLGNIEFFGLGDLLKELAPLDDALSSPFSVFIHGDMNIDNIIYDKDDDERPVRLIDVHRSRLMDYVQDVSVLLVSGQRLQIFAPRIRRRINEMVLRLYEFSRDFAAEQGDTTFQIRLALGLARSLASSARFVLDKTLAESMFLRAEFLLHHVARADRERPETYILPHDVLID